ncbi:hypothetical protein [Oscillibacter sp.]|uniref:sodium:solute symporter family transporter n=1 Tax=Oscillibacter sp. TaxID=1945593 RepID=UPI00257E9E86|nr:hypothetical protein [Oscillibacter sp.]
MRPYWPRTSWWTAGSHASQDQSTINTAFVLGISLVATLIALKPSTLTQYMINFALAALAAAWYFPVLVGMYWKKATAKGMFASTVGGFAAYVILYFISGVIPSTKGGGLRRWGCPLPG